MVYGLLGVVAMVMVIVAALVVVAPTDLVRDRLAAEVQRQTGRHLTIGSAGVSLLSGLGVTLTDVTLSAPPAMPGAPLLKAGQVEVRVALLPFILHEVKIERLTLLQPVIEFRVDEQGRRSWDFAALDGPAQRIRYAEVGGRASDAARLPQELRDFTRNASPPGSGRAGKALGLEGLSLTDVRITDGVLRYRDMRSGIDREFRSVDARLALPHVEGPLDIKGRFALAGEPMSFIGHVSALRDLLAERQVAVRLNLDGAAGTLRYDGKVSAGGLASADGTIGLKAPSLARLAALLQLPMSGLDGLGGIDLGADVRASATHVALSGARLAMGPTSATGSLSVDTRGKRPLVAANLQFAKLDLDRLLDVTAVAAPVATPGRFASPAAAVGLPPASANPPASIDDLLERSSDPAGSAPAPKGPQVRGFRQRAGNQWEIEPIETAALKAIDLDGRFHIAEFRWNGIAATGVQAAAELKNGLLRTSITDGDVGGGKVRGLASIDARQAELVVGANISGDGVAIGPLLQAAGINVIEGRGRAVVTLSARGASERELISTLAGKADLHVHDGSLVGWNADALLASLGRGEMPSTRRQPDARTQFQRLSGTFQIASGVARTRDLALESSNLHATGIGLINIVDRNIDVTFKPRIAASGMEVPVRVAGPWDEPKVIPDVAAALKTPQAQAAARQLKNGDVEGAVRSVLGGGPKAEKKIQKAKDFLRGFMQQ